MTRRTDLRTKRLEPIEMPSEIGVRTPSPASRERIAEAIPAHSLPEMVMPEPPSDWPETPPGLQTS
jgi:hypothetical protein